MKKLGLLTIIQLAHATESIGQLSRDVSADEWSKLK